LDKLFLKRRRFSENLSTDQNLQRGGVAGPSLPPWATIPERKSNASTFKDLQVLIQELSKTTYNEGPRLFSRTFHESINQSEAEVTHPTLWSW